MEVGINNTCNVTKTVCMAFRPVCKRKDSSCAFPHFQLNGTALCFVDEFKYMGHIINTSHVADTVCARPRWHLLNGFTLTTLRQKIFLMTLTFDLLTLILVRIIARGVDNLSTNFGVFGTFRSFNTCQTHQWHRDLDLALVGDTGFRAPSVFQVWIS